MEKTNSARTVNTAGARGWRWRRGASARRRFPCRVSPPARPSSTPAGSRHPCRCRPWLAGARAGAHCWMRRRPSARSSIGTCACAYSLVRGWACCVHEHMHMQLATSPRAPLHASPAPACHVLPSTTRQSALGTRAADGSDLERRRRLLTLPARAQKLCGPCPVPVRVRLGRDPPRCIEALLAMFSYFFLKWKL